MIDDLKKEWCGPDGQPVAGAVLLAANALARAGVTDEALVAAVAASVGVTAADLERVRSFHSLLVSSCGDTPVVLCRGVSCRINGAAGFHARLKAALRVTGVEPQYAEVHCLSQCEHGPNLRVGDTILSTGTNDVIEDGRTWRPPGAGPQVLQQ